MFSEHTIRSLKWVIVIMDIVVLYFLWGRTEPLVLFLFGEDAEVELAYGIELAHVLGLGLLVLFSGVLIFAWMRYIHSAEEVNEEVGGNKADNLVTNIIYFAAAILMAVELVTIVSSFIEAANDPYATSAPTKLDYLRDIVIAAFLVSCHVIFAYFTARLIDYFIESRRPPPPAYEPPAEYPDDAYYEDEHHE